MTRKMRFSLLLVCCLALLGCAIPIPTVPPSSTTTTLTASPEARIGLPIPTQTRQRGQVKSREQSTFGVEEKIERPVSVPEDVLQILRRDERNQQSLAQG